MTSNYAEQKKQLAEEFNAKISEFENAQTQTEQQSKSQEMEQISQQIRKNKLVYKEMKSFMGKILPIISPEQNEGEGSLLGHFLQSLWEQFFAHGPESYLKMSHLGHDVDPKDLALLQEFNIVEVDPKDSDRVKLVNFTE